MEDVTPPPGPSECPMSMLLDQLLLEGVFSFVGMNHYRFVAGTCRRFRELYTRLQREQHKHVYGAQVDDYRAHCFTITSVSSMLESLTRAKIYRDDYMAITGGHSSTFHQNHYQIWSGRQMRCQYATTSGAAFLRAQAVKHGKLEVLKWVTKLEPKDNTALLTTAGRLCQLAAQNGDLDILEWLREHGCPWDSTTCSLAAQGGHLGVLKWARENGCAWNTRTCTAAAAEGHLDILEWARENGCPWSATTCNSAVRNGHLEVLQWARLNGCEWNTETCSLAAYFGHLDILKWARSNGCEWDSETISDAVDQGHDEIVQWARDNGCPQPEFGGDY